MEETDLGKCRRGLIQRIACVVLAIDVCAARKTVQGRRLLKLKVEDRRAELS